MIRKFALLSVPVLWAIMPDAASAQSAEAGKPSVSDRDAEDTAGEVEAITVTARRREEALIDVPVSVTALSGAALTRANVASLADLARIAPAVRTAPVAGRVSSTAFFIRGLGEATGAITADPSTGIYFADAIQARPQGVGRALYDLSSVQVLHGPQGTLFGRNLTGGAVLLTPNPARLGEMGGYVRASYGNFDERTIQGAINMPIGDAVAIRAAGNLVRRDPFTRNIVTGIGRADEHSDSLRFTVNIEPSSQFSNVLVVDHFKGRSRGLNIIPVAVNPTVNTPVNPLAAREQWLARQQTAGYHTLVDGADGPFSTASNLGFTNITRLNPGSIQIKNIFSYRRIRSYDQQATTTPSTATSPAYPLVDITNIVRDQQFSNEIQVNGNLFDDLVSYTAGGYFFWERGYQHSFTASLGGAARRLLPRATNESKSLFAQFDIAAFDKLTFTVGGRYTWDNRSLYHRAITPGGVTVVDEQVDKSFGKFTYTLSANYKPSDDSLIYVTTRRGYRSGGFNAQATSVAALTAVNPEVLTDYELGLKYQARGFRVSAAAFHSVYSEIQRSLLVIAGMPPAPTQILLNAAKATVDGGELEVAVKPVRFIELSGFVSYVKPKYKNFFDPLTGEDLSDRPFSQTPKWTYRVAADITLPVPETVGDVRLTADYAYMSQVLGGESASIRPGYMLPGRGLVNARLAIDEIGGGNLGIAFYARNLTNKKYFSAIAPLYDAPFGVTRAVVGDPRTWGVEVSFRF